MGTIFLYVTNDFFLQNRVDYVRRFCYYWSNYSGGEPSGSPSVWVRTMVIATLKGRLRDVRLQDRPGGGCVASIIICDPFWGSSASSPLGLFMKHSHLPHIDLTHHFQFITFRTHDSVDAFIKKLHARYQTTSQRQYAIDQYLDQSAKGAYLNGEVLTLLGEYLKQNQSLFELAAFAIMPNHVHLLIKPLEDLPKVMNQVKGASARLINKQLGRKGRFWADDYFDKLVRDERHFNTVYEYIRNNPLGLGDPEGSPPRFYGVYE